MRKLAIATTCLFLASTLVSAQEDTGSLTWVISTTLNAAQDGGMRCALLFPVSGAHPRLRLSLNGQNATDHDLRFDLRGVGNLAEEDKAPVSGIDLMFGGKEYIVLAGTWRDRYDGQLVFGTLEAVNDLLDDLSQSPNMSVAVESKTFEYDLFGVDRAMAELRKCME